ncbi:ribosome biogenesis factor YjgA [Aliikangiella sp. IMCC44359]|uniref:ribosome biogenesis factor YjgA n=1 Tax=Aliikangiella sp. IMCC44359 TaxID=3459125 RepID=UPI00403ACD50
MNDDFEEIKADELEASFVSKTQLKNEAKELVDFGKQLIELSESQLSLLPLSENTMVAVRDYHKQKGNIARKRHLGYIGKCLRNDDATEAKAILEQENFAQLRVSNQAEKPKEKDHQSVLVELIEGGDKSIEALLVQNMELDRQTLRQLVRNVRNAKTEQKKLTATTKLKSFLQTNNII